MDHKFSRVSSRSVYVCAGMLKTSVLGTASLLALKKKEWDLIKGRPLATCYIVHSAFISEAYMVVRHAVETPKV